MIEIEYKTMLSKDEFDRLSEAFKDHAIVRQTNHYFDTPETHLKEAKMALRIRTFDQDAELTLKTPLAVGHREINVPLTLEEAETILRDHVFPEGEITQILAEHEIPIEAIRCFGELTTYRREIHLPIGHLAIDESHFGDLVDYELELEVEEPEQGKKDFDQFVADHQLTFKAAKSKIARLAESLK